jgi:hypothetical protein
VDGRIGCAAINERFIERRSLDGKPYLAALGMTALVHGVELQSLPA